MMLCLATGPAVSQDWRSGGDSRLSGSDQKVTASPGESLYDIARRQGYSLEHLAEANGLPVSLAPIGNREVLIPSRRLLPMSPPSQGVMVNLCERGFYIFDEEKTPRFFPVAIGEPGRFETPRGRFSIREKVVNPEWVAPEWAGLGEDNVVPAGPNNPLGDRWIGLSSGGLGMHSTNNPASIGSATSHGCMRMYPEVARTVFDLVQTGWPVTIEYQTSRVSIEADGIYGVTFPDPYRRGGRDAQLTSQFRNLDLAGFAARIDLKKVHSAPLGVVKKLVDLETKVELRGQTYPAARLGQSVYLEGGVLEQLGLKQMFNLASRTVKVSNNGGEVTLPLWLDNPEEKLEPISEPTAFLSRGTAWYPAKLVLAPMNLKYKWDGSANTLRLEP